MEQSEAEHNFLNMPELIERLFSLLDPVSALHLVQSQAVDKETLQKAISFKAWNEHIKSSSHNDDGLLQKEDVQDLVMILKLVKVKELPRFLLPLLDRICHSRPDDQLRWVNLICPCTSAYHKVSLGAFLLLEKVEAAFGTVLQSIRSIDALLSAISSRMSCQQKVSIEDIKVWGIKLKDKSSVESFTTLMKAKTVSLKSLAVTILAFGVGIGEEGWTALARALRSNINVQLGRVRISTQDLKEVKMEDMKDVWEVTGEGFSVCNLMQVSLTVTKGKYDWEQAWARLQQISEMKEEEFVAEVKKQEDED